MAPPPPHRLPQDPHPRDGPRGLSPLKTLILPDAEATLALGERFGASAPGGTVLAFRGGLGAGKTTFAKGVARGLGVAEEVTSPTYTIISEYEGRLRLHHMDAYRVGGAEEFARTGALELMADPGALSLVEWSELVEEALPRGTCFLTLEVLPEGGRRAILEGPALEGIAP